MKLVGFFGLLIVVFVAPARFDDVSTTPVSPPKIEETPTSTKASIMEPSSEIPTPTSGMPVTEPSTTTEDPVVARKTFVDIAETSSKIPKPASVPVTEPSTTTVDPIVAKKTFVDKLSSQIGEILRHFQHPEPVGFPGQTVLEDPLYVPNTTTSLGGLLTGDFYNISVHGMSNFTVEAMNTVLDQLEVYVMIKMKKLLILGNCTLDTIIGIKTKGPFNITLHNVTAEGTVFLVVDPEGRLFANRSVSYMTYDELSVTTTSGTMLQAALSGAGTAILAALKPYILSEIDDRITTEVNTLLKDTPKIPFVAEMSPVDLAIREGRKYVSQHYEPFEIKKIFEHDSEFLSVSAGPVKVYGLSHFFRVGKVTLKMVNSTVQIGIRIITSRLRGRCHFFYDFGKVKAERNGTADFTVEHLQFEAKVNQSVDLRKPPILDDLQIETGKIGVFLDGYGKLDYLVELSMQFLPQMLRYVIIDALEEPIKQKIQSEVLDKLNVDQIIQEKLPLLESILFSAI